MVNSMFWKNKRVLLTGHTGFKGSWLSIWLTRLGAEVCGVSLPPESEPSLFSVAQDTINTQSHFLDIRNYDKLLEIYRAFQPEVVFHMAAQPLVRRSYRDPLETFSTNIMGTANVLEAARNTGSVKSVVNVTTDKCYENREWVWAYRENEAMGGHDPYSASKGCAELLSASYRRSYFELKNTGLATARAGNVIGGGDWSEDRLIPDILNAINRKKTIEIRSPYAIRPWQHVLEPLSGYLKLAENLYSKPSEFSGAWNFGPPDNDAKSVSWIANKMFALAGQDPNWIIQNNQELHEANFLKLDSSKALQHLNWKTKWSLTKSLTLIMEWNKCWLDGCDVIQLCERQISEYVDLEIG